MGQLPQIWLNPVKKSGWSRICQKGPDAGPAGAEIRYIPKINKPDSLPTNSIKALKNE